MIINWHQLDFIGVGGPATYSIGPDGLKGVLDGVGTRGEKIERPSGDGDFDLPAYFTARRGSISGLIETATSIEYEAAIRRLVSIPISVSPMVIQSAAGELMCMAKRVGKPDVTPLVYGRVAKYLIEWEAPDPLLYGKGNEFSGSSVVAYHYGDESAPVVIEVAGPRAPYSITGPGGRVFQVTQALAAGQSHRIELSSGRVFRDGARQSRVIGHAGTWAIPPAVEVPMSISAGVMKVIVPDASS